MFINTTSAEEETDSFSFRQSKEHLSQEAESLLYLRGLKFSSLCLKNIP